MEKNNNLSEIKKLLLIDAYKIAYFIYCWALRERDEGLRNDKKTKGKT